MLPNTLNSSKVFGNFRKNPFWLSNRLQSGAPPPFVYIFIDVLSNAFNDSSYSRSSEILFSTLKFLSKSLRKACYANRCSLWYPDRQKIKRKGQTLWKDRNRLTIVKIKEQIVFSSSLLSHSATLLLNFEKQAFMVQTAATMHPTPDSTTWRLATMHGVSPNGGFFKCQAELPMTVFKKA